MCVYINTGGLAECQEKDCSLDGEASALLSAGKTQQSLRVTILKVCIENGFLVPETTGKCV